ncbi:MAG TPA: XisI protein [Blastocatellia bacterium]|nr:XisI protein [Blastocatellia bacterium]
MDKLNRYREIARQIIEQYAARFPADDLVQTETVIDPQRDHYEVLRVGWEDERRIHHSSIHLDIINGKIWIQHDGTNRPVADALLEAGVPHEDIVLGFQPPEVRQYTDFAAA